MIDGTKCVSDWMIHRRGPSCDQTQFSVWWKFDSKFSQRTTAGSCDDRVWSTGETMRGTGAIVFSTRVYFILPETVELNSCKLRSIDVCQRVNVKSNVIFCLLWRERHRVGGGSATSSNLFSESALNSTARRAFWNIYADESSCRVGQLSTVGRAQSIRNAIPLDLQSLRGGSWSGRMRCMRHRVPFSCTKRLWSNTAHAAHIYCWSCCEHCSYTWWQYVHRFVA